MSVSDSTYAAISEGGGTVLERGLLAIINAHTTSETEGGQAERLQAAMRALLGPITPNERDMERALIHMVRQRQKDACDIEMDALWLRGDARPRTCAPFRSWLHRRHERFWAALVPAKHRRSLASFARCITGEARFVLWGMTIAETRWKTRPFYDCATNFPSGMSPRGCKT